VKSIFRQFSKLIVAVEILSSDCVSLCAALCRNHAALVADNLFLRKQARSLSRMQKKARPTSVADRFVLVKWLLSLTGEAF
jgi:hypothetical protein